MDAPRLRRPPPLWWSYEVGEAMLAPAAGAAAGGEEVMRL